MLLTDHWSASGPERIKDYHVEFGAKTIAPALNDACYKALVAGSLDGLDLAPVRSSFNLWKNVDLDTVTSYGTWHLNSDPRDGSANIEVGALCMGGESVTVAGPWGAYPYTAAHAVMHCAVNARVCKLKGIDSGGSFDVSSGAGVLQNGPIFNISTHGERAIQTQDSDAVLRPSYGYFAYSGDGDCRWDIAALDSRDAHLLATPTGAYASALLSAKRIRALTHAMLAAGIDDFWGLDGDVTP